MPALNDTHNIDGDTELTPALIETSDRCERRALTDSYTVSADKSPAASVVSTSFAIADEPSAPNKLFASYTIADGSSSLSPLSTSYTITGSPTTPSPPSTSYTIADGSATPNQLLSTSYTISDGPSTPGQLATSYTIAARPATTQHHSTDVQLRFRTDERCIRRLWSEHHQLTDQLQQLDQQIADRQQQRNILAPTGSGGRHSMRAHLLATNQLRSDRRTLGRRAEAVQAQLDEQLGREARTTDGPMAGNITLLASRVAVGQIGQNAAQQLVIELQCGRITMPMVGRMYAGVQPAWMPTEQQMDRYVRLERAAALEMHVHLWRELRVAKLSGGGTTWGDEVTAIIMEATRSRK